MKPTVDMQLRPKTGELMVVEPSIGIWTTAPSRGISALVPIVARYVHLDSHFMEETIVVLSARR